MILLDKLYYIKSQQVDGNEVRYLICFNADHEILKGHFPSNPIIPGACIIQIISELVSQHIGYDVSMSEAKKIKFTNPIKPDNDKEVLFIISLSTTDKGIITSVTVSKEEIIFAKISATFSRVL